MLTRSGAGAAALVVSVSPGGSALRVGAAERSVCVAEGAVRVCSITGDLWTF